jgi:hypothetical protein
VQHSTDLKPRISQNPRFADQSGLGNSGHRVNRPDLLRNEGGASRRPEQGEENVMMVGSWPCNVSFEIHINGRRVSEPFREDKGKTTAPEPKDRRDPKRARVVLSKGRAVVRPGYLRVTDVATKVTDKRENLGNHGRVNRISKTEQHYPSRVNRVSPNSSTDRWIDQVSQNSNTDQQADRVGWVSWVGQVTRVSPNNSMDRRIDQVSRVNWVSCTEQKKGGSHHFANTESWIMENSANTESQITENSANMENWVTQDMGGKKPEAGKGATPSRRLAPRWCPRGITKTQNADYKRCIKESWPRKKKRKSETIGLTIYDP